MSDALVGGGEGRLPPVLSCESNALDGMEIEFMIRHLAPFFLVFLSFSLGCGVSRVPLDYDVSDSGPAANLFQGREFTIEPFEDLRQSPMIGDRMVLREGDDAGFWVANAIRLELERFGAKPKTVAGGARPATGYHVMGSVNIIESEKTGWQLGGLLSLLTGSGAEAHINLSTTLLKDGRVLRSHTYDSFEEIENSTGRKLFIGGTDIPGALQAALKSVLRKQLIPDLRKDVR